MLQNRGFSASIESAQSDSLQVYNLVLLCLLIPSFRFLSMNRKQDSDNLEAIK